MVRCRSPRAGPAGGASAAQNAGSTVLYAGLAGSLDGGANFGGHIFANYAVTGDTAKHSLDGHRQVAGHQCFGHSLQSRAASTSPPSRRPARRNRQDSLRNRDGICRQRRQTRRTSTAPQTAGSWTNISNNLPNAPANSLLVDPTTPTQSMWRWTPASTPPRR